MRSLSQVWRAGSYIIFSLMTLVFLYYPLYGTLGFILYIIFTQIVPFQKNWRYLPLIYMGINSYFGTTYVLGLQVKMILLVLVGALFVYDVLRERKFDFSFFALCSAFCIFILICLVRAWMSDYNYSIITTVYNGLVIFMMLSSVREEKDVYDFLDMTVISALAVALVGVLEFAIQDTFYYKLWTQEARYRNGIMRVGSTVSDPNFICFVLAPCLGFLIMLWNRRGKRFWYGVMFVLFCGVIALTQSRAGLLSMLFVIIMMVYYRIHRLIEDNAFYRLLSYMILLSAGIVLIITLLPYLSFNMSDDSFRGRTYVMYAALQIIAENPIFGIGFGKFADAIEPILRIDYGITSVIGFQNPMNTILQVVVDIGVAGLVVFLAIWFSYMKKCAIMLRVSDKYRPVVFWLTITAIVWLMLGMTLDGMFEIFVWILLIVPAMFLKVF